MWNYQAPGSYGRPPGMPGFPNPSSNAPGAGAPGTEPYPPGMQPPQQNQAQSGLPANFQPPPGINFNAAVIRMGGAQSGPTQRNDTPNDADDRRRNRPQDQSANRKTTGLGYESRGADQGRQQRDAFVPKVLSREQVMRTVVVDNITDGCGDSEMVKRILNVAGGLYTWTRPVDENNKLVEWGFAEYEDVDSLNAAIETLHGAEVPVKRPKLEDMETNTPPEMLALAVRVDANSRKYIEEWRAKGSMADPEQTELRIHTAKEELAGIITSLCNPETANAVNGDAKQDEPQTEIDLQTGEVVHININSAEDEFSDIPAEMRETVANEIKAFRERSAQRDRERIEREADNERRVNESSRGGRSGGGANAVPVGPRERGVKGAPTGPKGFQAQQNGESWITPAMREAEYDTALHMSDEDADESDEELERRRQRERNEKLIMRAKAKFDKLTFRDERKKSALQRQHEEDERELQAEQDRKIKDAKKYAELDDKSEAYQRQEKFYRDREGWRRDHRAAREKERARELADIRDEEAEIAEEERQKNREIDMADAFLDQQADEITARQPQPAKFTMSLNAAQRTTAAPQAKRLKLMEEFLEEDEEDQAPKKRQLVPLDFSADMTDEEREVRIRDLAATIPNDKEKLFSWPVKWQHLDQEMMQGPLRGFLEGRVMDLVGVPDKMLIEMIENHLKKRGKPGELVNELKELLDEDADVLTVKLWRMVILHTEMVAKGLPL